MAHISEDKVLESGVGVLTTSFTLAGAITGFRTFASQLAISDTCFYSAFEVDASGNPTGAFENGLATLTAGTTLTRTTVLESSNANAAVTFTGTLWISLTLLASKTAQFDNNHAMKIDNATAEPVNTVSGNASLYSEPVMTGLSKLFQKSEFGTEKMLQDSLAFSRVIKYQAAAGGVAAVGGGGLTQVGTPANATLATGSAKNASTRLTYPTAATAGGLASLYSNNQSNSGVWRGGANGEGGFLLIDRFSLQVLVAGNRGSFGLTDVSAAPANIDPLTSTAPGQIGLAFNANTGNMTFVHNVTGTAPTQTPLTTIPIDTTSLYELILFCPPFTGGAAQSIQWRVNRYTTSLVTPTNTQSGTASTNIPTSTTVLNIKHFMTNNATAAVCSWNFHSAYIASDF